MLRTLIAVDTETTGLDLYFAARPYLITATVDDGRSVRTLQWEWPVDPLTRMPGVDQDDVKGFLDLIRPDARNGPILVLHNSKFDVTALSTVIPSLVWPWGRTHDTLIASHLLASNQPHDLTSLSYHYLGRHIKGYEDELHKASEECRRLCRSHLKDWQIAHTHMPGHPSMEKGLWKADGWLPRAVCAYARKQFDIKPNPDVKRRKDGTLAVCQPKPEWWRGKRLHEEEHPWNQVLASYANADSTATLHLWPRMERRLRQRGLWAIYQERMKLVPIALDMESRGVTMLGGSLSELEQDWSSDVTKAEAVCKNVAGRYGHDLVIPKTGANDSLRELMFGRMKLPAVSSSKKTGAPSLDKGALEEYERILREGSWEHLFVKTLRAKRKRDTALTYLKSYRRFWRRVEGDVYRLHPNLNITGTDTLRWSCQNPNEQNISKTGMPCPECGGAGCEYCDDLGMDPRNLRYALGPAPGREWWSLDAKNLELRIPAYKSGEREMIALFERPDEPPFFGSNHLLNFSAVYPEIWARELPAQESNKDHIKKKYGQTNYQWCKNGGFAKQYGGQKKKVDSTFRVAGAYELMAVRFSRLERLNQDAIAEAQRMGYVETWPDSSVDPDHGYPVMVARSEWGGIIPTKPLNYKVQSTAMWWTARAMVRVDEKLREWRRTDPTFDGFLTMQVHDEIVLDFPRRGDPRADLEYEKEHGKLPLVRTAGSSNLWRIRVIQKLMEQGGSDIGVPTPCGAEWHPEHWGEGVSM